MILTPEQKELGTIFNHIAEEIDIPDSKYEDAVSKYEAVGTWLGKDDSNLAVYNPRIFTQGSFRLETCVKPLERDEFDIDLVCQLEINTQVDQRTVYNLVGNRLKLNKIYNDMIKPKNRCWRLNYSGDFHMDVLPAILDNHRQDQSLLVPDKKLSIWKKSNPEGYAEWFYSRMKTRFDEMLKEARSEVESVPEWKIKTPLQRAIQILKRHRDIKFKDDPDDKPVSIVLTTLAAKSYNNEVNLYEALISIIKGMRTEFDHMHGDIAVLNPTNSMENFTDKWNDHPQRKDKLLLWLNSLESSLSELLNIRGLPNIGSALEPLFEKSSVKGGIERYAQKTQILREQSNLKIDKRTGYLGVAGTGIRKNTFYGE